MMWVIYSIVLVILFFAAISLIFFGPHELRELFRKD